MKKLVVTKDGVFEIDMTQEEIDDLGGGEYVEEPIEIETLEQKVNYNTDLLLNIDFRVLMLEFGIF